jgi:haloalkane dehalogenase
MSYGTSEIHAADWRQCYPFESRWLELADGRMHYIDECSSVYDCARQPAGSSSASTIAVNLPDHSAPLLFIHGNPTWSFHWRQLILALRPRYRCVAPDHVGCGLSNKPARFLRLWQHVDHLAAFIERLRLERITLVAQDWGGAIGLGALLRMPERLERIILFNTGAFPPRYIPLRIRACRVPFVGQLAVQGANLFSHAAVRMTLARRRQLEPAVAAGYLAPYDSWANRRAVFGFVRDIPSPRRTVGSKVASPSARADSATYEALTTIERGLATFADRPIALIWGMRDWCFRPDCLDRFIDAWPNAEVHRLADVGHWVVEDAPEESIAIVDRFLAESPCREPSTV